MNRVNELQSPRERLKTLFRSVLYFRDEPTHDANYIRMASFMGAGAGLLSGAIMNSPDVHQEYQRKHNASVFDNKYAANRHFWDTLITGIAKRGIYSAIKVSALTTSITSIAYGSIAYRNRLYFPDFLLGMAIVGGGARLWLGPRAIMVGSLLGGATGIIAFGFAKMMEQLSGLPVAKIKLLHHQDWLQRREAKHKRLRIMSETELRKKLVSEDLDSGE